MSLEIVSGFPIKHQSTERSNLLQWRHNECDGVSNYRRLDGLLKSLFSPRSMETPKRRVTGLCVRNSLVTGEFPAQMATNAAKCFHLITSSCSIYIRWLHKIPVTSLPSILHIGVSCGGITTDKTIMALAYSIHSRPLGQSISLKLAITGFKSAQGKNWDSR